MYPIISYLCCLSVKDEFTLYQDELESGRGHVQDDGVPLLDDNKLSGLGEAALVGPAPRPDGGPAVHVVKQVGAEGVGNRVALARDVDLDGELAGAGVAVGLAHDRRLGDDRDVAHGAVDRHRDVGDIGGKACVCNQKKYIGVNCETFSLSKIPISREKIQCQNKQMPIFKENP